jgi:hypothetical protein
MKNEDALTTRVEELTKHIPSIGFLELALGSIALSATLQFTGRKEWANFVGQWAPTFLLLGIYNKLVKTFSAPYDEEQRAKSADELNRQESARPLS